MDRKRKLSEEEIQEALKTDPKAIAYRNLIIEVERVFGRTYAHRVEVDYWDYVDQKYRDQ